MKDKILTIAIPTFNRNLILKKNLQSILRQFDNRFQIVIIDNHSDIPVTETLADEIASFGHLEVIRNKANVGLSGNVIKCFELCKTEWLWVLGDDDEALPNIVPLIEEYLTMHSDVWYFNFNSDLVEMNTGKDRYMDTITIGINQFFEKIDSTSNVIFISSGIYNVPKTFHAIKFAYLFSYTVCPHYAYLLMALGKQGKVLLSKQHLVTRFRDDFKTANYSWSRLYTDLAVPTLYELPLELTKENKKRWAIHLQNGLSRPIRVLSELIPYIHTKNKSELNYLFTQINLRRPLGLPILWKIEYWTCKLILNIYPLALLFERLNKKIRERMNKGIISEDIFNRI